MRSRLPLTALRALDAAARLGTFTAAAADLGVTRPAISKQIRQLELDLGCRLIDRSGNTIRFTQAGQDLSLNVGAAFDQIARTTERIKRGTAAPKSLRILVDRDFASSFLAAHIGDFLVGNPGVSVEVTAERNGRFRLDEDFSFRIFYGYSGAQPSGDLGEEMLCRWFDMPVCTPDYARAHVGATGDLIDAQILVDANYDVWADWFRLTGQTNPGAATGVTNFNETSLCLSAAMSGGGITIGDTFLAFPAICSGILVVPFRFGLESAQSYAIFSRKSDPATPAETSFRGWLFETVRSHQNDVRAYLLHHRITTIQRT